MNYIKRYIKKIKAEYKFKKAYLNFIKNPKPANDDHDQGLLRNAFVHCGNKILDWAHDIQIKKTPYYNRSIKSDFFPELCEAEINKAVTALDNDGYYIMPWLMPPSWVRNVREKASELFVTSRNNINDVQKAGNIVPKDSTYWHDQKILDIQECKDVIKDEGIIEIIARHLKCDPCLDLVTSWWTFPNGAADTKSAQLYHFDLDRVKWIKVFVYLTDVTKESAPHAFIKGSHKNIGSFIKRDGRFTDEEVFSRYLHSDEIVFTGPAGLIILEDTLGLHKGCPAIKDHRFIFEFEYSINQFGSAHPKY